MMRLAASNIGWNRHDDSAVLTMLSAKGMAGIEVAPSKVWPNWEGATVPAARSYRLFLEDQGFVVPALQAIVFGHPELTVFGSESARQELIDHLRYVADLANALAAKAMVLGAPKNRDAAGLDPADAFDRAVELFTVVAQEAATRDTSLCVEPNPPQYGCNFVTDSLSGVRLVEAVDLPGFALHLDAAAMHLAGEDGAKAIRRSSSVLRHFHASEPELGTFSAPVVDHAKNARALAAIGYRGWVSIEMRATSKSLDDLAVACDCVRETYGVELSVSA